MHQRCNKSQVMVFSLWAGLAGSGGRADAHPGADGEECQHERTAGQRQRLTEQLPAPCQSPTARDSAEGQGLHWGGLRQGDYLNIYVFCQAPVQKIKTITVLIQTLCVTSHTFWQRKLKMFELKLLQVYHTHIVFRSIKSRTFWYLNGICKWKYAENADSLLCYSNVLSLNISSSIIQRVTSL